MRRTIMAGLVALLAGCGPTGTAAQSPGTAAQSPGTAAQSPGTAARSPGTAATAPARVVSGCAGHRGTRLAAGPVPLCSWRVGGADGGTLYWSRYPHSYQYYWQPRAGDMLVTETFYLPGGPLGMPIAWDGRLVTLGDGCVAAETGPPKRLPSSCIVVQEEGRFRGMTPAERQSVADFWSVMRGFPAGQW